MTTINFPLSTLLLIPAPLSPDPLSTLVPADYAHLADFFTLNGEAAGSFIYSNYLVNYANLNFPDFTGYDKSNNAHNIYDNITSDGEIKFETKRGELGDSFDQTLDIVTTNTNFHFNYIGSLSDGVAHKTTGYALLDTKANTDPLDDVAAISFSDVKVVANLDGSIAGYGYAASKINTPTQHYSFSGTADTRAVFAPSGGFSENTFVYTSGDPSPLHIGPSTAPSGTGVENVPPGLHYKNTATGFAFDYTGVETLDYITGAQTVAVVSAVLTKDGVTYTTSGQTFTNQMDYVPGSFLPWKSKAYGINGFGDFSHFEANIEALLFPDLLNLNNSIVGSSAGDTIEAGGGNDTVNAGAGNDLIIGGHGSGDDTYYGGEGIDTIRYQSATADITVDLKAGTAGSSNATLSTPDPAGIGSDKLYDIENIISGNYNDRLIGNSNDNVLSGMLGKDVMTGNAGKDMFVFSAALSKSNIDVITDFKPGEDKIGLGQGLFSGIANNFSLYRDANNNGFNFDANAKGVATSAAACIIYNSKSGDLFYDADGMGFGSAVQFAHLANSPKLAATDFLLM